MGIVHITQRIAALVEIRCIWVGPQLTPRHRFESHHSARIASYCLYCTLEKPSFVLYSYQSACWFGLVVDTHFLIQIHWTLRVSCSISSYARSLLALVLNGQS